MTRTHDLLITNQLHYRLCYTSVLCVGSTRLPMPALGLWPRRTGRRSADAKLLYPVPRNSSRLHAAGITFFRRPILKETQKTERGAADAAGDAVSSAERQFPNRGCNALLRGFCRPTDPRTGFAAADPRLHRRPVRRLCAVHRLSRRV